MNPNPSPQTYRNFFNFYDSIIMDFNELRKRHAQLSIKNFKTGEDFVDFMISSMNMNAKGNVTLEVMQLNAELSRLSSLMEDIFPNGQKILKEMHGNS